MPINYVNRKQQLYYLHQGTTKTGKPKYFFSMKSEGNILESLPDGYEIYENPNAQVFLRKIEPSMITGKEKLIVEEAIKKKSQVKDSILDIKKEIITIYTPDQNIGLLSELINFTSADKLKEAQAVLKRSISYSPMLRFILIDEHQRIFITQRYCFLGRIDDWINIGDSNNLQALVKKYVKHLGQESFFELH
ncbi:unknown protein (plasmid) [Nostoc sp. NIES-3756]|uniref:hypothetical protein n=1 Tax=Nostoc sp. NIES-3756 TaxID=1751286 RepID=UPI000720FC5B|nr:hypothetical protein [Nostoc sp. NIES-3756]BAT56645.1 unknown protein [Nostoc sp. NIES-3756]